MTEKRRKYLIGYNAKNKEKVANYMREYYQRNREGAKII